MINALTGLRFTADQLETQYKNNQAELAVAKPTALQARVNGLHRLRGKIDTLQSWEKDMENLSQYQGYSPEKVLTIKLQLLLDLSIRPGGAFDEDNDSYHRGVRDIVQDIRNTLDAEVEKLYWGKES